MALFKGHPAQLLALGATEAVLLAAHFGLEPALALVLPPDAALHVDHLLSLPILGWSLVLVAWVALRIARGTPPAPREVVPPAAALSRYMLLVLYAFGLPAAAFVGHSLFMRVSPSQALSNVVLLVVLVAVVRGGAALLLSLFAALDGAPTAGAAIAEGRRAANGARAKVAVAVALFLFLLRQLEQPPPGAWPRLDTEIFLLLMLAWLVHAVAIVWVSQRAHAG